MDVEAAQVSDAGELAELINLAGEGIPAYLWSQMAEPGQTSLDVGVQRAARDTGGFSYRNAKVIRDQGRAVAMLIAYQLDDPYDTGDLAELPPIVRPLIELEALAPGSWYINAIATDPAARGRGLARKLMQQAEQDAAAAGAQTLSLIVASENQPARALYAKLGYECKASRPVVDYPGALHGGEWQLLLKPLN
ncbi:GNAT family N-acetyltransferase [Neptuniibacter sp. CAU 1671]|uniref:GNAT family N-acetyltransferase n=1 Tax=Neptuniibacter sp. CAU 1671 TaxID=3032593 RepID=UPI0023DC8E5A|nr:GNAT family N-acetyltransferase [Neptuniibacter sp. CAU 1671]MDF2181189.1 GNAT family N-acetyltransferase [Neptuniibacter sp. CAU 1671]